MYMQTSRSLKLSMISHHLLWIWWYNFKWPIRSPEISPYFKRDHINSPDTSKVQTLFPSSPHSIIKHLSKCPIFIKFQNKSKHVCLYLHSYQSDHIKILHIPRQQRCLDMCKILLWLDQSLLNYSNDNFNKNLVDGTCTRPCWSPFANSPQPSKVYMLQ